MAQETSAPATAAPGVSRWWGLLPAVVLVGYAPLLNNWWFHDDWVFLADAAGLVTRDHMPVRFVSYEWWWRLLWPVFGLAPAPWAVARLLLHFGSAWLLGRIARRAGQPAAAGVLAGLLFAASPVAYECLVWGTGVVDLLAVCLGLLAVERWLAGGAANRAVALAAAGLAIFSKEVAYVLPLLAAVDLWRARERRPWPWLGLVALLGLSAWAFVLVKRDIAVVTDYVLDYAALPRNLLVFGYWLVMPAPAFTRLVGGAAGSLLIGAAAWLLWAWGAAARRAATPLPAVCLAAALLTVAPATSFGVHVVPRYDYGATAALALAVGVLVAGRERAWPRRWLLLAAALLTAYAWVSTEYLDNARWNTGRPMHRLAFKEEVSRVAFARLAAAGIGPRERVVLVRGAGTDDEQMSLLWDVIGGERGLRLLYGPQVGVRRVDDPADVRPGELVVTVEGISLRVQGRALTPAAARALSWRPPA